MQSNNKSDLSSHRQRSTTNKAITQRASYVNYQWHCIMQVQSSLTGSVKVYIFHSQLILRFNLQLFCDRMSTIKAD